jgi:hypothetical protein
VIMELKQCLMKILHALNAFVTTTSDRRRAAQRIVATCSKPLETQRLGLQHAAEASLHFSFCNHLRKTRYNERPSNGNKKSERFDAPCAPGLASIALRCESDACGFLRTLESGEQYGEFDHGRHQDKRRDADLRQRQAFETCRR